MKADQFCYWLQGFFEISGSTSLDEEQVEMVKRHLNLCFHHDLDRQYGGPAEQAAAQAIHDGEAPAEVPPVISRAEIMAQLAANAAQAAKDEQADEQSANAVTPPRMGGEAILKC